MGEIAATEISTMVAMVDIRITMEDIRTMVGTQITMEDIQITMAVTQIMEAIQVMEMEDTPVIVMVDIQAVTGDIQAMVMEDIQTTIKIMGIQETASEPHEVTKSRTHLLHLEHSLSCYKQVDR